jgi:integrase
LKLVRGFFGHHRAMAVTSKLFREFIEEERALGRKSSTINRKLEVIIAAFNLAVKEQRLPRRPHIPLLSEVGNARQGFFELKQHELMVARLPKPIDDIARFAYICGWRQTECRLLRWEYVDRAAREVRLPDSKNGRPRVLPLEGDTWTMFESLWSARQFKRRRTAAISEYVFHRRGRPVDATTFAEAWAAARSAAGDAVKGKIFHDYRRTAARNMIRAGVPQSVAHGDHRTRN